MKKSIKISLLVIILLVGGVLLCKYYFKKPAIITNTPSTNEFKPYSTPNGDFITHHSFGFSFDYPKNWFLRSRDEKDSSASIDIYNVNPDLYKDYGLGEATNIPDKEVYQISVRKSPKTSNRDNLPLEDFTTKLADKLISKRITSVAGIQAVKIIDEFRDSYITSIFFQDTNFIYELMILPSSQVADPIFENLVKSFKLTENNQSQ